MSWHLTDICLPHCFLTSNWSFPCNTITIQKYFRYQRLPVWYIGYLHGYLEFVRKDRKRGQSCHEYGSFCSRQARVKMILKTERKLGLGRHWDILQSDRSTCEKWTEWPLSESLVDEGIFNKVKGIKMQSLDFKRTILEPEKYIHIIHHVLHVAGVKIQVTCM